MGFGVHGEVVSWRGRHDLTTRRSGADLTFDISSDHVSAHVRLTGSVTADTTLELGRVLGSLIQAGHVTLVLHLADAVEFSPVAVGVLNCAAARLAHSGGMLVLDGVAAPLADALRAGGLDGRIALEVDNRPKRNGVSDQPRDVDGGDRSEPTAGFPVATRPIGAAEPLTVNPMPMRAAPTRKPEDNRRAPGSRVRAAGS